MPVGLRYSCLTHFLDISTLPCKLFQLRPVRNLLELAIDLNRSGMSLFSSLPPAVKRDGDEKQAPQALQKEPRVEAGVVAKAKRDGGTTGAHLSFAILMVFLNLLEAVTCFLKTTKTFESLEQQNWLLTPITQLLLFIFVAVSEERSM